ncbi:hypothetical protein ACFPCY_41215 [Actinomadura gamaensis]|uniref:Uncharacterized protein n=1 Tax=Actinomadura gamaensis TaxID=1763541 RepID=A0ABV9UDZ0_9ACTN
MSKADEEARRRAERAQQVALWKYQLIREAADPALTTRQRGRLVRQIAGTTHDGPNRPRPEGFCGPPRTVTVGMQMTT